MVRSRLSVKHMSHPPENTMRRFVHGYDISRLRCKFSRAPSKFALKCIKGDAHYFFQRSFKVHKIMMMLFSFKSVHSQAIKPPTSALSRIFPKWSKQYRRQQIDLQNRLNAKYCHANGANSVNTLNIMERTELNSSDMIRSNSPHRYSCGKGTHLYVFINQSHLLICLRVSKTHREMSFFSAGGVLVIV